MFSMSEETKNTEAQVETPEVQEVATETTEATQSPEEFLSSFDWHKYEEGIEAVDEAKLKEFEAA